MPSTLYRKVLKVTPIIAILIVASLAILVNIANAYIVAAKRNVNYVVWNSEFQNNQSTAGFPASTRYYIRQGMYQWDDVKTNANFNVDESYSSHTVWVSHTCFPCGGWLDAPGRTTHFKIMGKIVESTIWLNNTWTWVDNDCAVYPNIKKADIRIVTTHEAGHLISLDHDQFHTDAVMWPDNTCKLQTVNDDDKGVRNAYGWR